MKKWKYFLICLFIYQVGYAQLADDFEDGNLSVNPVWVGDIDDFIVEQGVLRLNAPSAGTSMLSTGIIIPDSFELSMYIHMDFDPSSSNFLSIKLHNSDKTNYYEIRIGENGADDNFKFYRFDGSSELLIGNGTLGALAKSPEFRFRLVYRNQGDFQLFADYENDGGFDFDAMFFDNQIPLSELMIFEISCTYTSSRADDFYFDNILLKEYAPDIEPPQISNVDVLSSNCVVVSFDEQLSEDVLEVSNYSIVDGPQILSVDFHNGNSTKVKLNLGEELSAENEYILEVINIIDLMGNSLVSDNVTFRFIGRPEGDDLKISEILFDPYSGGEDFIEIYNGSSKYLQLEDVIIGNAENGQQKRVSIDYVLEPGEYVALSEDIDFLRENYLPPVEAKLLEVDLPAFDNSNGNPLLLIEDKQNLITLDSMSYVEDQHFELIDDTEGVSLERISFLQDASDSKNWYSSSELNNWATPGYENAASIVPDTTNQMFSLQNRVFSPSSGDDRSFLVINYRFEELGNLGTVNIYSSNGQLVRSAYSNQLLSTQGILIWNGLSDDNEMLPLGPYVVIIESFDKEGNTVRWKDYCVIADNIN